METFTKQTLWTVVNCYEKKDIYKRAKPTYELNELVDGGYIIPSDGTYTWMGREINCTYYKPTPKGYRFINPDKKMPEGLGGTPNSNLIVFNEFDNTIDFCKKYLYDEPYLSDDGHLTIPYSVMYRVLRGNKFYKCKNKQYFRHLNKHLFEMDTANVVSAATWQRVLEKVNERVDS